jgi:class 3 adenylate cyclase
VQIVQLRRRSGTVRLKTSCHGCEAYGACGQAFGSKTVGNLVVIRKCPTWLRRVSDARVYRERNGGAPALASGDFLLLLKPTDPAQTQKGSKYHGNSLTPSRDLPPGDAGNGSISRVAVPHSVTPPSSTGDGLVTRRFEICPLCKSAPPPAARFCPACGQRLDAANSPPLKHHADTTAMEIDRTPLYTEKRAERRQLTVAFCDLVGSSELATKMDPEDLTETLGRFHRCVAHIMGTFDGFYTPPLGDGALVFFGFPTAHENDAERAIQASLRTLEAIAAITGTDGRKLHARIGVATGVAVVGNCDVAETSTGHRLYGAGEALNLAARLQQLAEPDMLVVNEDVRRLAGGLFIYRELGHQTVKGWGKPIAVFQVLHPSANPSRFAARTGMRLTPFIGRDAAIKSLMTLWSKARDGVGQVAFVTGEMGMGKSRLSVELLRRTKLEALTRVRWFCAEHQQGVALYPCLQQLEHAARLKREDPPASRRAKLQQTVLKGSSIADFALIGSLLHLPIDPSSPIAQLSLPRRRARTLHALIQVLKRLCEKSPVLAIVEDVHWCDPTTRELLTLIVHEAKSLPLLVVMTARPHFTPDWSAVPCVTRIPVEPLSASQSIELIRFVRKSQDITKTVMEAIVDRCDGVPLFLEEVTRAVVEAGRGNSIVPASIHASLLARLDKLGSAREVAEAAAAIGRSFSVELLRRIWEGGERPLTAGIERLLNSGLIFVTDPPEAGLYRFKHALIHDAARSMMLRGRRRTLHRQIAQTLEVDFSQYAAAEPQTLAYHCTEGGLVEKAIDWWRRAAVQSLQRAAASEAMEQLRRGLELCGDLSNPNDRRRLELDLQLIRAKAIIATEGQAGSNFADYLQRAQILCAELGEPPQLATVMFQFWTRAYVCGDFQEAAQRTDELLALAARRPDVAWNLLASFAAGFTYFTRGSFGIARQHLCRGIESFDVGRQEDVVHTVGDPRVMLRNYLAWERMCTGHISAAWEASDASVDQARSSKNFYSLACALANKASMHSFIGEPHAGLVVAEELESASSDTGIVFYKAIAIILRGWFYSQLGNTAEGLHLLQRGSALYQQTGTRLHLPMILRLEAELLGQHGRVSEGLMRIAEAKRVLEETEQRWDEAETYRAEGQLLNLAGEKAVSVAAFEKADRIAVAQGARLFALRARISRAKLQAETSQRTTLSAAASWFASSPSFPDLSCAEQLLRTLDRSPIGSSLAEGRTANSKSEHLLSHLATDDRRRQQGV